MTGRDTPGADGQHQTPRLCRVGLLAVTLAGAMLLLVACGGHPSADPATSPADTAYQQGIAHSECMRAHGLPGFPDPDNQGIVHLSSQDGFTPNSPQFLSALKACAKLQSGNSPETMTHFRQNITDALRFAACMRAHGILKFPDPVPFGNGGVMLTIRKGSGVDVNSPQFAAATRICGSPFGGKPKRR